MWTLAKKEFLENILNQRFVISLALAALLAWASTFVLTKSRNDRIADYQRRVAVQDSVLNNYFHRGAWSGMTMRPPKRPPELSALIRGIQHDWSPLGSIDENPVTSLYPPQDLVFIISIIVSLTALVLSSDRISGEKQNGTLRLLLTEIPSRSKLLFGKWIGGIFSLTLILAIVFCGSVAIGYYYSGTAWTGGTWVALAALFLLSALFCMAFYALGLLISARTATPSDSVILALVAWVIMVIILPTIPPYITSLFYHTETPAHVQYQILFGLDREMKEAIRAVREPWIRQGFSEQEAAERTTAQEQSIREGYSKKRGAMANSAITQSLVREGITALIHALSPFSSYSLAAAELSNSGAVDQLTFTRRASDYESVMLAYLDQKEEKARAQNPDYSPNTLLDIRDRPRFTPDETDIAPRLLGSLLHTLFVAAYGTLFLVLAVRAFRRYDPR